MKITKELLNKFEQNFKSKKENILLMNAITKNGINNASFNNEILRKHNNLYSHETKNGSITNQKSSGRCWIFASLNMARISAMKKFDIEDIELSQSYLHFFDKIEKANTFLENIIQYGLDLDFNDPKFKYFMDGPIDDGGFWEWFLALINKYGIVPKALMPDTATSINTHQFLEVLNYKAKEYAMILRNAHKKGADINKLRELKEQGLNDIYSICVKALGMPPKSFNFQYKDKDKKTQKLSNVTPVEFYEMILGNSLNEKVNLVSDAREIYPYGKVLSSEYFNSVYESANNKQLNVPMEELIKASRDSILDGVPVPHACDVGKMHDRKLGIMDTEVFDYANTLVNNTMTKADRMNYFLTMPTHLMSFTGVDLDENKNPIKWKVENSWGTDNGFKGFFSMSNEWFIEYNFQCVVDKKYVDPKYLKGLEEEPIILPMGDPLAYLH
ncbi:aminopeptidase C [Mycoplasma phocoenae]|uniref:Aminopeptidase n=1 Tax=Mycoplasma phocoenae TaxID=754517 RepID=A0A858U697_9MOLU|nr:C1 family peptidase [Mycoplasma phocoenae]QJG66785.1 C1 family peptidase [Mycoplasma phocoenae]